MVNSASERTAAISRTPAAAASLQPTQRPHPYPTGVPVPVPANDAGLGMQPLAPVLDDASFGLPQPGVYNPSSGVA